MALGDGFLLVDVLHFKNADQVFPGQVGIMFDERNGNAGLIVYQPERDVAGNAFAVFQAVGENFANLDLNVFNHDAENVFGQFEASFGNPSAVVISRNFAGRIAFVFYGRVLG